METILRGKNTEVVISTSGPVVIIGECINPTRRKRLVSTLQEGNFEYVLELAREQIRDFAEVLDVNVGFPGVEDEKLMPEVVKVLEENFDIPLCIDTPNPKAVEAALKVSKGKCLINSVNGEEKSLRSLLPVAKEYGAAIIGLLMDDEGITHNPEKRLAIAEKIINRAVAEGIPAQDVIIDPMAMAVSADPAACLVTLDTIKLISSRLGHNMTLGASNISFGLPAREYLNSAFISLAVAAGITCPIAHPGKIAMTVRATDLVLGRDDFAIRYIETSQKLLKNS